MNLPNLKIVLSFYLTFANLTTSAQELLTVRLSQYTQNHGLSSPIITKIHKDQYGFLWAGTQEGLNVFDGQTFEKFSNQSVAKRNIGGSMVQDLAEDRKRSILWLQTAYADICALNLASKTIVKRISEDDQGRSYSKVWARCIHFDKDVLWIGGLNNLSAYDVNTDSFLNIKNIQEILAEEGEFNLSRIITDKLGQIWFFNEGNGIVVTDQSMKILKSFGLQDLGDSQKRKLRFWDVVTHDQHIYVASSWGLLHFNIDSFSAGPIQLMDIPILFADNEILSIDIIPNSRLLIASSNNVYILDLITKDFIRIEDEEQKNRGLTSVFKIMFDEESELIWTGTKSGLSSFSFGNKPFSAISRSLSANQKIKHLYSILALEESTIYAGGDHGIYHIDTKNHTIDKLDTASTNLVVFEDNEKNVFISNSTGFYFLNNNKVLPARRLNPSLAQLEGDQFNDALQYNDSLILFSSIIQKGLTIWNTQQNVITTYHNDSANHVIPELRTINYLYKGRNEDIFILTEKSIIRFNPLNNTHSTHVIRIPDAKKTITNFMDMCETNESYFLGTYGDGMIETDKTFNVKNIYTTASGLSNNCVYRLFNVNNKSIIATSNLGLSVLNLDSRSITKYYEGDGLHGNGFEQLCGFQLNEKIYVGGSKGLTVINTKLLPSIHNAPVLYPTTIEIDAHNGKLDSSNLFMTSYTVPHDAQRTTLNFVSPDFKNPKRMNYRYKIKELGKDWVDLGNQNFVDLIGINPGTYHFEVQATNSLGIDSESLEIKLDFLPKWYQTHWFKVILLLAVGLLIYFIQRYRMIQIRKQQQIRTEIANDLHDDIGSTLNSLKIFTHLAQYEPENKGHLDQIEQSITSATVGLRDMIWVLEDEQDSVYEVMERIQKFAQPICLAHTIELKTYVDAEPDLYISKKIKRNFLLIAKECINNSIKYAQCDHLTVSVEHSKSRLIMIIEDDGIGFDANKITKGKGLESIQYRAQQIQFACKIITEAGNGTKTELSGKGD